MMDFIFPCAILVDRSNFTEILHTVPIQLEALTDIHLDSIKEDMRYYIVGWRDSVTGLPTWQAYTEVELACEYRLKDVSIFKNTFRKIPKP